MTGSVGPRRYVVPVAGESLGDGPVLPGLEPAAAAAAVPGHRVAAHARYDDG